MVAQVNITSEDDCDFYQTFSFTLSDGVTPINLLGASYKMSVRRTAQDTGVLFTITGTQSASGQIIPINAPQGIFAIWITQAALAAAPYGTFAHSLVATIPGVGAVPTLATLVWTGAITINAGPSR